MEPILILVTILAAVSARNIPDTNYVPTKEQLALIFGAKANIPPKLTTVETPDFVPNESYNIEKKISPYQKKNEIFNIVSPESVEVNIKIKVSDCDKNGVKHNVKQNPEKSAPDINSRFVEDVSLTDDRVALEGNACPTGRVRINNNCVQPD